MIKQLRALSPSTTAAATAHYAGMVVWRYVVRRSLIILLLAGLPAIPSAASDMLPGDKPVPVEEWRRLTEGRVVWYSLNGRHWGREYFHVGRNTATFVANDGTCMTAPWVEADGIYCFAYSGMDCFRHIRRGEQLLVLPLGDGDTQTIEKITDDGPLSCEPPLSS